MNFTLLLINGYLVYIIQLINSKLAPRVLPRANQYVPFDDMRSGKRFDNGSLVNLAGISQSGCAMACNRHPACRSFNFCGRTLCELLRNDVFSVTEGEKFLVEDPICVYVGMGRNDFPVCRENGTEVLIVDDELFDGQCKIHKKRVDREWGPWEAAVVDTLTEWKEFERRDLLIEGAHGSVLGDDTNETSPSKWYQYGRFQTSFYNAKSHCEGLGGKLFSKVDGTKSQLDFFREQLGELSHWAGIYTQQGASWLDIDGNNVANQLIVWAPGQPQNVGKNNFALMNIAPAAKRYFKVVAMTTPTFVVCDMI